MLNDNRKIDYRNKFSFSYLHYLFSKWIQCTDDSKHGAVACLVIIKWTAVLHLAPGAAITKLPPPVIFCQVRVSHIYVTESMLPLIFIQTRVSHICSGWGDFTKKLEWMNYYILKTKFVSFIAKRQNKTCCWFHSFTLFTAQHCASVANEKHINCWC